MATMKNKWESQRIHKRNNRKQRASKHYRHEGQDVVFKKKKPIKQRRDYKKFKIQRRRKKIYKQLSFDLDDFILMNKNENYKRIQIRPAMKCKNINHSQYNITSIFNAYYCSLFEENDEEDIYYDSTPIIQEEYIINAISIKTKNKTNDETNHSTNEYMTKSYLKNLISQQTLIQPQKIHIYPLLNKYAMQRWINKQQRDGINIVYTSTLLDNINYPYFQKSQQQQPQNHHHISSMENIYGDKIVELCSMYSFIHKYCGYHSLHQSHDDIISLCILYAGYTQNILPFGEHNVLCKLNHYNEYVKVRNNPIKCDKFDNFNQYIDNLTNGMKEIYVCLLLNNSCNVKDDVYIKDVLPIYHIKFENNVCSMFNKMTNIKIETKKECNISNENKCIPELIPVEYVTNFANCSDKCYCWCGCNTKITGKHKGYKYNQSKNLGICFTYLNNNKFKVIGKRKTRRRYTHKGWWSFHERMTAIPANKRGLSLTKANDRCGHGCCIYIRRRRGTVWKVIRLKQFFPRTYIVRGRW